MPNRWTLTALLGLVSAALGSAPAATPELLQLGARTYVERCVLCHGNRGMGEGLLPLLLRRYPNTNLIPARHSRSPEQLRRAILQGGRLPNHGERSPPWSAELAPEEVEALVQFVVLLRQRPERAAALRSQAERRRREGDARLGARVFRARCALCHGKAGDGNGRMARMIQGPPPANLRLSQASPDYLRTIIRQGGQGVGRSGAMPPWGDELSAAELDSLLRFLLSLRERPDPAS